MKCLKCKKETKNTICDLCFPNIIEKRVRKELRISNLINKDDKILILDNNSAESVSAIYMLKRILKDLPVEIKIETRTYDIGDIIKTESNKIIIPWNCDLENEYFLRIITQNQDKKFLGHFTINQKLHIKMFLTVLHSEVIRYAKSNKLDFLDINNKNSITEFIDKLELEYPEAKFSLLKSSRNIDLNN